MRWNVRLAVVAGVVMGLLAGGAGPALAADGGALYDSKCALCHGKDGVAKEMWAKKGAENFNDAAWQKSRTDEQLTTTIKDGVKEKMMPAYKDKLSEEEIQALVKHIRSLAPAS